LLGVRTQVEGFSTDIVGFIVASYFLGLLLGGMLAGRVVARVGHIRSFAAFASLMSITALLHLLWISVESWMLLRMLSGFCMAGLIMVTESWFNERASNVNRGQVLSFYMITNYFAAGSGQLLLSVGDPSQFQLFSLASVIFSLALLPVLLTQATAPAPMPAVRMPLMTLYRLAPLGMLGFFCSGRVNASVLGLGPVYATNIGLSKEQLSLFMAGLIMSGLLLQWPVGRLSDRIGRGPLLMAIPVLVVVAIAALLMTQVTRCRDGSPNKRKPFVVVPATQATSNQLYISAHDASPDSVATNVKSDPKF